MCLCAVGFYVFTCLHHRINLFRFMTGKNMGIRIYFPLFGTVMQWLSLLRNFIQLSLNSGTVQVQTLLAACRRFLRPRMEIRLNAFHRSTIPQKQFIMIIMIIIIIWEEAFPIHQEIYRNQFSISEKCVGCLTQTIFSQSPQYQNIVVFPMVFPQYSRNLLSSCSGNCWVS